MEVVKRPLSRLADPFIASHAIHFAEGKGCDAMTVKPDDFAVGRAGLGKKFTRFVLNPYQKFEAILHNLLVFLVVMVLARTEKSQQSQSGCGTFGSDGRCVIGSRIAICNKIVKLPLSASKL